MTILRLMPDTADSTSHRVPILSPDDPPPFTHFNWDGAAPMLLICDHASNRVPRRLDSLGLEEAELRRHIGWDIGAAELTKSLATRLDSPALLASYSRLVVDNNRSPDDPTSMPEISDGVIVPRNHALSTSERAARRAEIFQPYHQQIERKVAALATSGPPPMILSIHSFTPVMRGEERPWHVSVLWRTDPRLPQAILQHLRNRPDICAGDNVPYSAHDGYGYTVECHAEPQGLAHALLEVRQDLIDTPAGIAHWGDILGEVLLEIVADGTMHEARQP